MKTISIRLTDEDFSKYGISSNEMPIEEFVNKVKDIVALEALNKAHNLSEKAGLDKMSMDEINAEIAASRNAKDHS